MLSVFARCVLLLSACACSVVAFLKQPRPTMTPESLSRLEDDFVAASYSRLYSGEDLNEEELEALDKSMASFRLHANGRAFDFDAMSVAPAIKVVGMFGSGTNLMEEYLHQNDFKLMARHIDESLGSVDAVQECEKNEASRKTLTCSAFWKHTHPSRIEDASSDHPVNILAMVRNPLSQISSWKRQPFNLYSCFSHPHDACECQNHCDSLHCGDDPLGFPCGGVSEEGQARLSSNFMSNLSAGSERLADSANVNYANAFDVWNKYTQGYSHLAQQDLPVNTLVVRYEDLVLNPDETLQRVAGWLQVPTRSKVTKIDDNARKFDPGASGRDAAVNKITTKSYRNEFAAEEVQFICGSLNSKLLASMKYSDECKPSSL